MTTTMNITDEQIEAISMEAATSGDFAQVAICEIALTGYAEHAARHLSRTEKDGIDAMLGPTPMGEARAECARVIAAEIIRAQQQERETL